MSELTEDMIDSYAHALANTLTSSAGEANKKAAREYGEARDVLYKAGLSVVQVQALDDWLLEDVPDPVFPSPRKPAPRKYVM